MIDSIDVIAQSMVQISESISSMQMSICILAECRGYMEQILHEIKGLNEQLKDLTEKQ